MRSALLVLLLALFACSAYAYVSGFEYYSFGEMRANYVNSESNSQNRGRFLFVYEAKSKSFKFWIQSTLSSVGTVGLYGPISCYNKQNGGTFGQGDPNCASVVGPMVLRLGKGINPAPGEDVGFQIFKGEVTLSPVLESMFFRNELNLQINTVVTGANGKDQEIPAIRGQVYAYDHFQNSFYSYMVFENNRGQFDRENSKTSNSGFGYLSVSPGNNNLGLVIYTTIKQPGAYVLKCSSGTKVLEQDDSPIETSITFSDEEAPLLLEILLDKSCYIFINSAEAPNGDLYSYLHNVGTFEAIGTGARQEPPVQSPYISYSLATFEASYKTLDILTKHNITDTVTAAHVHAADGTVLCDLASNGNALPIRSFCRLNSTSLDALENGDLYINIHTEANPNGEVRGQLVLNSRSSSAIMRSTGGSSGSTAIGLGVGLGVGIPLFLLAIVGLIFVTKKGGGNGKI